ncbi:MAG: hypothetical protein R3C13_03285 [Hyphomonas sp.]|uniref:hypothetical protein n=1 Tax=Hyphomonas sp. TaxID=87 RepID=UPI003528F80B
MGNGNKAEMLIAVCAVMTSVIALFVAWDQGRVMRAQQHGAVYPVIQMDGFVSTSVDRASLGIRISNSGVGPAIIESVRMLKDGKAVEGLSTYRDQLPANYDLSWAGLTGRALAPGDEITPIDISWKREDITSAQLAAVAEEWGGLVMEICYCSVFDRCWRARDLGTARAERVPRCERGTTDIFEELRTAPRLPEPEMPEGDTP